ncbi:TetR/AcrR family transcriptional regulator [Herbiconiux sp. UC225_62]|uniref:TetR/AcrR family transcriptional regulator n=1 Tax=Herbiconiux sp. UC225_62 TaxID=3350168 RepID=UPI0036D43455
MNDHRAGPTRSAAARESILDATARLFREQGYDHLTIEGIARAAGVGKQTIYRWWPSRGALIADCLIEKRLFDVDFDVPNTGDLVADVEMWLGRILTVLENPDGSALLRSLVGAATEDAAVGDQLSASLGVERSLAERLSIGVADGQLPPGAPVEQVGDAILGAVIVQSLSRRSDSEESRRLVRFLLGSPDSRR